MSASTEIYFEHERWGRALSWSAGFHLFVVVALLVFATFITRRTGETWGAGGGGDAIGAMASPGQAPVDSGR